MEIVKIPENHNFYKFLIVEELAFYRNIDNFHHGKCSTIGTVIYDDDSYFLENLRIKGLPKKYWLPDGSLKIRLLTKGFLGGIQEGKTAEVSGQAVLYDSSECDGCWPYTTSAAIAAHLNEIAQAAAKNTAQEVIASERERLEKRYEPALLLHRLRAIDRARDLIERNLQMRMLRIYD